MLLLEDIHLVSGMGKIDTKKVIKNKLDISKTYGITKRR